jgi:two-component system, NarL family, invasion response regulator UvrY
MEPVLTRAEGSGITCLLADDSEPLLEALEELLTSEGIGVVGVARTGIEALQLLEQQPATALIVDLRLPDIDGVEVARRAAEIVRRKTFVILYTSAADSSTAARALDVGARGIVLKGASQSNLLEALSRVAAGEIYVDPELR